MDIKNENTDWHFVWALWLWLGVKLSNIMKKHFGRRLLAYSNYLQQMEINVRARPDIQKTRINALSGIPNCLDVSNKQMTHFLWLTKWIESNNQCKYMEYDDMELNVKHLKRLNIWKPPYLCVENGNKLMVLRAGCIAFVLKCPLRTVIWDVDLKSSYYSV